VNTSDDASVTSNAITCCAACGSADVARTVIDEEMQYGAAPKPIRLHVRVPTSHCRTCDSEFTDGSAEEIRHEAVCRYLGVLTPNEVRDIRTRFGMSRQRFADVTRLGVATLARWESGEVIQNAALDTYLRLVSKPDIFQLLEAGTLLNERQTVPPVATDEQSFARFPTLASTGAIAIGMRRAQKFELAPRMMSS
jgi:putative zinc finger/helix-turn-helix YgiT family protein